MKTAAMTGNSAAKGDLQLGRWASRAWHWNMRPI
jgi:hypothetical protein